MCKRLCNYVAPLRVFVNSTYNPISMKKKELGENFPTLLDFFLAMLCRAYPDIESMEGLLKICSDKVFFDPAWWSTKGFNESTFLGVLARLWVHPQGIVDNFSDEELEKVVADIESEETMPVSDLVAEIMEEKEEEEGGISFCHIPENETPSELLQDLNRIGVDGFDFEKFIEKYSEPIGVNAADYKRLVDKLEEFLSGIDPLEAKRALVGEFLNINKVIQIRIDEKRESRLLDVLSLGSCIPRSFNEVDYQLWSRLIGLA